MVPATSLPMLSEMAEQAETAAPESSAGRGRRLAWSTAVFIVISPWVMRAFGYGQLAVNLSRLLFPIVVLLGLSGIVVGILNSYEHFTVPALSPVFWNVAIIVGLVIGVPRAHGIDHELYVYALAILLATVLQFLLPLPW